MKPRVLITGGSGFIGYHMARRLCQEGYQVDLVDNFSRGVNDADLADLLSNPNVRLIELDLAQPKALEALRPEYDFIYHFAAIVGVAGVLKRPYEVLSENLKTLMAMLEFAKRIPDFRRFVFPSTSEVYAGTLEYFVLPLPTPENTPLAITDLGSPRTSYMLSKICGEALCHYAGVPFTIIRPHNIYGPRMGLSHVIPELLRKAFAAPDSGEIEVFSTDHRRTFCFVSDAVAQIRRAAELPECNGVTLNVGSQAPEITIGALAELIAKVVGEAMGKELKIAKGPTTAGSVSRRCPDMTQTTLKTGCKSEVGLEAGIRATFGWYQKHVFEKHGLSAI